MSEEVMNAEGSDTDGLPNWLIGIAKTYRKGPLLVNSRFCMSKLISLLCPLTDFPRMKTYGEQLPPIKNTGLLVGIGANFPKQYLKFTNSGATTNMYLLFAKSSQLHGCNC